MTKQHQPLPRYSRVSHPPPMRLTERDQHILEAIHAFDGMLSFSQIQRKFFTSKSQAETRLKFLYQHRYVNRPNLEQRRRLPAMIYWLDRRGAEIIASLNSIPLQEFTWRKEPRWFQVEHDLAINDFRIDLEASCQSESGITLETWIPESEFWAYPDKIIYTYNSNQIKRNIRPDGFFTLTTGEHRLRYLLEIDRSTEDNPRFLREKILPGLAYLKSKAYEERFNYRSGRWLVVTTGMRRMQNMLSQARKGEAKGLFYFTTFEKINSHTILHAPIWYRIDRVEPVPLLFLD
ncbi:MAG: replication-relaxation family protein [Anaerolineales bacterium]|nr:replication-relaxation family protein [Anaerolineales bacterium]